MSYGAITVTVNVAGRRHFPASEYRERFHVNRRRSIYRDCIRFTTTIIAQVSVPNVVGDTQSAATAAITSAGLVAGTVTMQSSSTVPSGEVISESPVAGTRVAVGSAVNLVVSTGAASGGASATYSGLDTKTLGTWTGKYGSNGYSIASDATNTVPSYATLSFTGDSLFTWSTTTTSTSALQVSSGSSSRLASCYYSGTSFNINLNLTDGNTHQISLYLLDYTSSGRAETISILNAANNAVLSTQTFSSFTQGEYAVWNITGNVIIQVTKTGSANAVVSGIFFDPLPGASVPNVVGDTQAAATTAIQNAGLVVGTVTTASSSTVPSGDVISESPVAGTSVAAGSAVNLVVSTGAASGGPRRHTLVWTPRRRVPGPASTGPTATPLPAMRPILFLLTPRSASLGTRCLRGAPQPLQRARCRFPAALPAALLPVTIRAPASIST